jgi:hypothetical protein
MAANDADRALSVYTLADLRFVASVRVGFVPRALEQSGWRILDVTGATRTECPQCGQSTWAVSRPQSTIECS